MFDKYSLKILDNTRNENTSAWYEYERENIFRMKELGIYVLRLFIFSIDGLALPSNWICKWIINDWINDGIFLLRVWIAVGNLCVSFVSFIQSKLLPRNIWSVNIFSKYLFSFSVTITRNRYRGNIETCNNKFQFYNKMKRNISTISIYSGGEIIRPETYCSATIVVSTRSKMQPITYRRDGNSTPKGNVYAHNNY